MQLPAMNLQNGKVAIKLLLRKASHDEGLGVLPIIYEIVVGLCVLGGGVVLALAHDYLRQLLRIPLHPRFNSFSCTISCKYFTLMGQKHNFVMSSYSSLEKSYDLHFLEKFNCVLSSIKYFDLNRMLHRWP